MAQVNPLTRELLVKLVYYGPGLGGKTTSLQHIHRSSPAETRGQLVSLATPVDRTLYFDFLPLRVRTVREHQVRLQLFTVPGQVYFNATRKLVLTGADGVVFVADSQPERQDANLESLENLGANLEEQGRKVAEVPLVFEYNKRDLEGAQPITMMERTLNALRRPSFGTVATSGEGVMDALDRLVQDVLDELERQGTFGPAATSSAAPDFGRAEEALETQLGGQIDEAVEGTWRASVEKALIHATNASYIPEPMEPGRSAPSFPSRTSVPAPFRANAGGPSWSLLFEDTEAVRALEADIVAGRYNSAIARADRLIQAQLDDAGRRAGVAGFAPAIVASWLGVPAPRWLSFRAVIRRAQDGGPLDARDALLAFGLLVQLRMAVADSF